MKTVPHKEQVRIGLRVAMLHRGLGVSALAKRLGHPRQTVSKAINHGRYPRVVAKVKAYLHA